MDEHTEEEVWKGPVRLHDSIQSYISEIEDLEPGLTLLTVRDGRFRFPAHSGSEDFPPSKQKGKQVAGIFLWLKGEKLEGRMDCAAVYASHATKEGLLGKKMLALAKGFLLSPAVGNDDGIVPNVMYALRVQGAADSDFKVDSRGNASFYTGSQVQSPDSKVKGTSSRTYLVIASNEHPFVAYIRRPQGIYKLICDSDSIRETSVEGSKQVESSDDEPTDLFHLKLRLLRGEITKAEFELKRSKLESA